MTTLDIITIISQIITFLGIIFIVFNFFRNPQIKSEKIDALLEQKVRFTNESNDRRFIDIQNNIKSAFELAQNHTHTVEINVNELTKQVHSLEISVERLSTIISERIPSHN